MIKKEDKGPDPDWDRSWQKIRTKTFGHRKIQRSSTVSIRKWIAVAATCCFVFILGYYIGKNTILNYPQQERYQSADELLRGYSEKMEMLFIDFSNRNVLDMDEETAIFEAEMISGMMVQTRVLKHLANQKKYEELVLLLEDIEMILVSISNLRPEDQDSRDQLNRLIRQGSLRTRLRALTGKMTNI
jgi:hypothetical protein